MKALRRIWNRLAFRQASAAPEPGFSYRIYWTKTTWNWSFEMRERVLRKLQTLIADEDFVRSRYERLYSLDELGEGEYSGESLACLGEVLMAYEAISR